MSANAEESWGMTAWEDVDGKFDIGSGGEKWEWEWEFINEPAQIIPRDGKQKNSMDLLVDRATLVKPLPVEYSALPSDTILRTTQLPDKLRFWLSSMLSHLEELIAKKDRHARKLQDDKFPGDPPQSTRESPSKTFDRDVTQDNDESNSRSSSSATCAQSSEKPPILWKLGETTGDAFLDGDPNQCRNTTNKLEILPKDANTHLVAANDQDKSDTHGRFLGWGSSSYVSTEAPGSKTCSHLAAQSNLFWEPGQIIKLAFLDGDATQHEYVMTIATEWERYGNIHFTVVVRDESDIRVSFEGSANSSYIGTAARGIAKGEPTVRLGIKPWNRSVEVKRVILHEFGHVLGCVHEHSSPKRPFEFVKKYTCDEYLRMYHWDRADTEREVLKKHRPEEVVSSKYDSQSIMHYSLDPWMTTNKVSTPLNFELSKIDQETIGSFYPFPTSTEKAKSVPASKGDLNRIQPISHQSWTPKRKL